MNITNHGSLNAAEVLNEVGDVALFGLVAIEFSGFKRKELTVNGMRLFMGSWRLHTWKRTQKVEGLETLLTKYHQATMVPCLQH